MSVEIMQAPSKITANLEDVKHHEFDYVVVGKHHLETLMFMFMSDVLGGGTTGLTLATRLAEDATISVAVLEAGGLNFPHPSIDIPAQYGKELGNPYLAFGHTTATQKFANNRSIPSPWYTVYLDPIAPPSQWKPSASDINIWSKLGTDGWDWTLFDEHIRKAENFIPPAADEVAELGITYDSSKYGQGGPISIGITTVELSGEKQYRETMNKFGVPTLEAAGGPDILGTGVYAASINPQTGLRSYSANSYFVPNAHRPNLKVLTNAPVTKIIIPATNTPEDDVVASGVEFEHGGDIYDVHAKKEVIVSAGTLATSTILERSGIGNKEILEPLGIPVKVHNPQVGENLQEHCLAAVIHEIDAKANGWETLDGLADPEYAAEQRRLQLSVWARARSSPQLDQQYNMADTQRRHSIQVYVPCGQRGTKDCEAGERSYFDTRTGLEEQYKLQIESLKDNRVPDCEFSFAPFFFPVSGRTPEKGKLYNSIVTFLNKPFSRGSIHIQSEDDKIPAVMDPNIFEHDIDLQLLVESLKFVRKAAETAPYKERIVKELSPGPEVSTDEQLAEYVRSTVGSTWHAAGTCAMLPMEKGGVVDSNLRIYGTKNIRVADLSIIPLHMAAHPQTMAYAIGEILAGKIKGQK
ncbi:GMC oxidoreductase [Cantharellus anzutake]|uniref:GMC oxidoreductase n=1 Tax=Cantharellus anzutake TaxID=1750568 RepID=UPI001905C646|nr:GMC oxidoreductase [Cantharellus anzutake]KAF8330357.1 GMC oxidoreductase [Cantharellus anzutake]